MTKYKHLVRLGSESPEIKDVTSVLASGGFYVIQIVDHGYLVGQQVDLTGFSYNPDVRGVHTITSIINSFRFIIDVAAVGSPTSETGYCQLYNPDAYTEVYPLGFTDNNIQYEKSTTGTFFKKSISNKLTFCNRPSEGVLDYDYAKYVEDNLPCDKIDYILQKECDGVFSNHLTGYFSIKDGEWDHDACTFKVKISSDEAFDCIENDIVVNILDLTAKTTYYVAGSTAARNYTNTRLFSDVMNYLVTETCSMVNGVSSNFFQINPRTVSIINYVTGEVNPYTAMTIGVAADLMEPIPSELKSEANITFRDMMESLYTLFGVAWTIENGFVIIEHISYFEASSGLDLTQSKYDRFTTKTNKYSYDTAIVPRYETFLVAENTGSLKITHDNYCSNSKANLSEKKYISAISNNLYRCRAKPEKIKDDEALVLIANVYNSGTGKYDTIGNKNNALTALILLLKFQRHNRAQDEGDLSGYGNLFTYSVKKNKKQIPLSIPLCCDDDFDPTEYMTTDMGKGSIDSVNFDIKSNKLTVGLIYGPDNNLDITPDDITGLTLWLKADDANAAGAISSWPDQSGNARHATQATGAKQPIKVLNVNNGLPAIRFDGTDDGLATPSFQAFPSKRGSMFVVFKCFQPITANDDLIIGTAGTGSGHTWDLSTVLSSSYDPMFNALYIKELENITEGVPALGSIIGEDIIDTGVGYKTADYGLSGFVLLEMIRDEDAVIHYYTNGSASSFPAVANTQYDANPINIGNGFVAGNSDPFKGDIAEIVMYDTGLDTINRQKIENYLMKKYALVPYPLSETAV